MLDDEVLALHIAEVPQSLGERPPQTRSLGISERDIAQDPEPVDLVPLLRPDRERRGKQTESEHHRESDPPHGHLGEERLAGSLADVNYWRFVRSNTSQAARWVACQGVDSRAEPVTIERAGCANADTVGAAGWIERLLTGRSSPLLSPPRPSFCARLRSPAAR